jgi:N-acetylmuramoyl-L-alanine amidase
VIRFTGSATAAESGQPGPAIPETLGRRVAARPGKTAVAETEFPLSHVAVAWQGPADGAALRVRTSDGWAEWQPLHGCGAARDGVPAQASGSALLTVPDAVGYELVLPAGATSGQVTEINTVDGPVRTRAAAPADQLRFGSRTVRRRYLKRAAWGADESLRFEPDGTESYPPAFFPVQTLTVHHTAGINDDPDPAATMRAIYYDQTVNRKFGDFGYHLAIDEAGRVYEGRYSGTDPFPVFGGPLGPNFRPQMCNAAHVGGFNAGNVGVVLFGNFQDRKPTDAARRTLTYVLAILAGVCDLDPLGTTNYVNPISGVTKTVRTIAGHRDWAPTLCPGDLFYPDLPQLRQDVADLIH